MASITGKWVPFVSASDIHGDHQDKDAVRAFFNFCKRWKPKLRIINGDLFDFRPLRKKCDAEEKREAITADFHMGMNFLQEFKPTTYLLGNHCQRLYDLRDANRGLESEFAAQGVKEIETACAKLNCTILPYDKSHGVHTQGDLQFTHGFAAGVGATRKMAMCYGRVIFGHTHALDHTRLESRDIREAWNQGCLCGLHPKYAAANLAGLRHRHGWAYGLYNKQTGENIVWLAQKTGDQWLLPTGIESL